MEEWKSLANYIEQGFHILEKQSVYMVAILAAAVGVGLTQQDKVPDDIWIFAPYAILVLLYRLLSQITFAFFQAKRVLEIELEMQNLLSTSGGQRAGAAEPKYLWYGHTVNEFANRLKYRYAYLPWLWLQELLGLFAIGYSTYRAVTVAVRGSWAGLFVGSVVVLSVLWAYQAVSLGLAYKQEFGVSALKSERSVQV